MRIWERVGTAQFLSASKALLSFFRPGGWLILLSPVAAGGRERRQKSDANLMCCGFSLLVGGLFAGS